MNFNYYKTKYKAFLVMFFAAFLLTDALAQLPSYYREDPKNNNGDILNVNILFGVHFTGGDMADRFGNHMSTGLGMDYITSKDWIVGAYWNFFFGSNVKEDVLLSLRNEDGFIFGGNQEVSSLRIERTTENNKEALEKAISTLFNRAKEANYPEDFRKEIYKDWQNELRKQNCQLHLQESYQNEDRFTVSRNNDVVNFNLRYTVGERNYGFFSSLTIKEKSTENLAQIIKALVGND